MKTVDKCYMCEATSTSDEHVPPRCLFPEQKDLPKGMDLRKDLIKVPSCDVHNSIKSKDDEYILYVLVLNIPNNIVAQNHFFTKIKRAIERNPSLRNKFLDRQIPIRVHDTESNQFQETIAVQIDTNRFWSSMEHMARALYFHHFKKKWLGPVSVYPDFLLAIHPEYALETNEPIKKMAEAANVLFSDIDYFGKNPDVFKYQIIDGTKGVHKIMRLHFYGGSRVTIFFKTVANKTN